MGNNFDLDIALAEFVIFHNHKKHSITGFIPLDIRDINDKDVINLFITNIIKSLSCKLKQKENNIKKGCFILLSTKISKKGTAYNLKKIKEKNNFNVYLRNL